MKRKASQDFWGVFHGFKCGHSIITRIRTDLEKSDRMEFPFRVGVAVPLLHAEKSGLPIPEENIVLLGMEEYLFDAIEFSEWAVPCAVLVTGGMKEFVLYSRDQDISAIKDLQNEYPNYQVQHYVQEDRDWVGYEQLKRENGV